MKQLLIACSLLLGVAAQAQKMLTTTLDLTEVETGNKQNIPFCAIEVLDVRFDRSNIGSVNHVRRANSSRVKTDQATAVFPDSLHLYFPEMLQQKLLNLNESSKDTLVLLVKQFRLADRLYNGINRQFEPELLLRLSFSAYCRKEGRYTRLFAVDELISKELPSNMVPKEELMQEYRKEMLLAMLQKALAQKMWQGGSAAFAAATVQQGLQKRFQLPIFTDTIKRIGVYCSFREFKQNAPSFVDVRLTMDKDRITEITDSTGKPVNLKNFWGVCNGRKRYIIFRNELCELFPSDKSFYFSSYIKRSELAGRPDFGDYAPQTGLLGAGLLKHSEDKIFQRYFYLNMEEENIYLEEVFGVSGLKQMEKDLLK